MKQITFASRNHQLTNINTWTPDSQWLVYDVRRQGRRSPVKPSNELM